MNIIHLMTIYLPHTMPSSGDTGRANKAPVPKVTVWCGDKQDDGIKQYQ